MKLRVSPRNVLAALVLATPLALLPQWTQAQNDPPATAAQEPQEPAATDTEAKDEGYNSQQPPGVEVVGTVSGPFRTASGVLISESLDINDTAGYVPVASGIYSLDIVVRSRKAKIYGIQFGKSEKNANLSVICDKPAHSLRLVGTAPGDIFSWGSNYKGVAPRIHWAVQTELHEVGRAVQAKTPVIQDEVTFVGSVTDPLPKPTTLDINGKEFDFGGLVYNLDVTVSDAKNGVHVASVSDAKTNEGLLTAFSDVPQHTMRLKGAVNGQPVMEGLAWVGSRLPAEAALKENPAPFEQHPIQFTDNSKEVSYSPQSAEKAEVDFIEWPSDFPRLRTGSHAYHDVAAKKAPRLEATPKATPASTAVATPQGTPNATPGSTSTPGATPTPGRRRRFPRLPRIPIEHPPIRIKDKQIDCPNTLVTGTSKEDEPIVTTQTVTICGGSAPWGGNVGREYSIADAAASSNADKCRDWRENSVHRVDLRHTVAEGTKNVTVTWTQKVLEYPNAKLIIHWKHKDGSPKEPTSATVSIKEYLTPTAADSGGEPCSKKPKPKPTPKPTPKATPKPPGPKPPPRKEAAWPQPHARPVRLALP